MRLGESLCMLNLKALRLSPLCRRQHKAFIRQKHNVNARTLATLVLGRHLAGVVSRRLRACWLKSWRTCLQQQVHSPPQTVLMSAKLWRLTCEKLMSAKKSWNLPSRLPSPAAHIEGGRAFLGFYNEFTNKQKCTPFSFVLTPSHTNQLQV